MTQGPEQVAPIMWAYCHEDDVVDVHLKALKVPTSSLPSRSESFFIISDDTRSDTPTDKLIQDHWAAKGVAPPELTRPLPGFTSIVSNAKAKRLLGFAPRSFRD